MSARSFIFLALGFTISGVLSLYLDIHILEGRLNRLEKTVRGLCTHGESSVAARKLPSGRVVTVLPATTTGCAPGR